MISLQNILICVVSYIVWFAIEYFLYQTFVVNSGIGIIITFPLFILFSVCSFIFTGVYVYIATSKDKTVVGITNYFLSVLLGGAIIGYFASFNLEIYTVAVAVITGIIVYIYSNHYKNIWSYSWLIIAAFTAIFIFWQNDESIKDSNNNIFTQKQGFVSVYCEKSDKCKKYTIPSIYDSINRISSDNNYACPYFAVQKNGKTTYINRFNKNIFKDYDDAQLIDIYKYTEKPIVSSFLYFKVKKDGKFGLYEIQTISCDENQNIGLSFPCIYDDIDVNAIKDGGVQQLNYVITKQNNNMSLYYKHGEFTRKYKQIYSNKRSIKFENNDNSSVRMDNGLSVNPRDYNYIKVIIDDVPEYIGYDMRIRCINKRRNIYTMENFKK